MSGIADDCGGPARQVPADDGGPAFPTSVLEHGHGVTSTRILGMSLRDYFATHAVQSVLLDSTSSTWDYASVAMAAYEVADAMLVERAKCKT